ncbi:hypothetical protein [Saccharothrix australiensis]|uniref:Uncharacterized protein n=1 Tax=Saccharothrix australiensis TaxID=2072 RepID=A0A495W3W4_9PSEU|nr:hypothetical protein [Saccharothrix australiensis]RKT54498.1 hypothetical protein C8E97_3141 [Saccharothrix australiensis]
MVVGWLGKASLVASAGLLLTGLSGVGPAGAEQRTRVAYSIEFADPGEHRDPEPYGAVVLRQADQDRLLWHQGRAGDIPSRWRYPTTGAAVEEVPFPEDAVEQVCAFVNDRDGGSDDRLADGCLPYRGHHEPYVIKGADGHVTVHVYGIG